MACGRGGPKHKGDQKQFTNPDELEQNENGGGSEERNRHQDGVAIKKEESESEESSSEDVDVRKMKGPEGLIVIKNPNRKPQRSKKVSELDAKVGLAGPSGGASAAPYKKPELSRRERARAHYLKLRKAGKTYEALADLARLAIVRKQREEAAEKREEKLDKENADKAKTAEINKALGKTKKK